MTAESLGLAHIARLVFQGVGVEALREDLLRRVADDPADAGALLDLSILLQLTGNREGGLQVQAMALNLQRSYRNAHGAGRGPRVLLVMQPGDFMANTPLDFALVGSEIELISHYWDGAALNPSGVPDHDVAFLAIGQSDTGAAALERLVGVLDAWPKPVINGRPDRIAALTRDGVAARFAADDLVLCPATRRMPKAELAADGPRLDFPLIVRPVDSHAGHGLERMAGRDELDAYLAARDEPEFYVSSFIDYAGEDGLFRKLRVIFVDGRPLVAHMAVSERWMVHYLNADMATSEANRAEEASMMATFDAGFAARHAEAFRRLCAGVGLDYFGIDCAETRDGRLLVFEADVAMIVHDMDPVDLYPYKPAAMQKLFGAVAGMIAGRV